LRTRAESVTRLQGRLLLDWLLWHFVLDRPERTSNWNNDEPSNRFATSQPTSFAAICVPGHFWIRKTSSWKRQGRKYPAFSSCLYKIFRISWCSVSCYCCGKLESPKSCDIQTICAIMKEIRAVTGMARFLELRTRNWFPAYYADQSNQS